MGWEVGGGLRIGNTCTPVVDSCWCVANLFNSSIKIRKFSKIKRRKKKKKKWSSHHSQQKSLKCSTWKQYQKKRAWSLFISIQYHSYPSLELAPQKRCPFHYRGLECKSRKSRNTWSNRQIWLWSAKQSKPNVNRVLPRERTVQRKHPLPTTQEKTTHGHHQIQIDYILCSQRWRSSIKAAKTRPGADCGSDHELLIVKFRLKLKKVGKTTLVWLKLKKVGKTIQVWPK